MKYDNRRLREEIKEMESKAKKELELCESMQKDIIKEFHSKDTVKSDVMKY